MKPQVLERLNDAHGPIEVIEQGGEVALQFGNPTACLLYTSDAADE